ncbi:MAG: hypothetical protein ACR2GO_03045 [Candidatus Limnocylindria bacterium]
MSDQPARREGPTEVVESDSGELVERLAGGTATLLLTWLVGIGALSMLLAVWLFVWIATRERIGISALFSGFGLYTAVAGAAGPCVLWLAGRAQGHSLGWFIATAMKIALVMLAVVLAVVLLATLVMAGVLPGPGAIVAAGIMALMSLALAVVWALATWSADRWIARARVTEDPEPE